MRVPLTMCHFTRTVVLMLSSYLTSSTRCIVRLKDVDAGWSRLLYLR